MRVFALVATVVLAVGGPMKVRAQRPPRYGQGATQIAPATTLPTAYQLATSAIDDADKWWQHLGSTPPPLQLQIGQSLDGEHNGFGQIGGGQVTITPQYLQNFQRTLTHSNRHGQIALLVGIWRLMAHERGHNLGYGHIPGGIMDETWAGPPGESYVWAQGVLKKYGGRNVQ